MSLVLTLMAVLRTGTVDLGNWMSPLGRRTPLLLKYINYVHVQMHNYTCTCIKNILKVYVVCLLWINVLKLYFNLILKLHVHVHVPTHNMYMYVQSSILIFLGMYMYVWNYIACGNWYMHLKVTVICMYIICR